MQSRLGIHRRRLGRLLDAVQDEVIGRGDKTLRRARTRLCPRAGSVGRRRQRVPHLQELTHGTRRGPWPPEAHQDKPSSRKNGRTIRQELDGARLDDTAPRKWRRWRPASARADLLRQVHALGRSRLPVWEGEPDNIIGVLTTREMLAPALMDSGPSTCGRCCARRPWSGTDRSALDVVDRLRIAPAHMVLVYDEYGHFEGIITPIGHARGDRRRVSGQRRRRAEGWCVRTDGSYLVDGWDCPWTVRGTCCR